MEVYLKTVLELCPNQQLHPIHHNALHLSKFLLRFGPVHGWWMFPFERLIGILQKINTNSKMGKIAHHIISCKY